MNVQNNLSLASYTSYGSGGSAETALIFTSSESLLGHLQTTPPAERVWFLGYGTNTLISDSGLPGTTFIMKGGDFSFEALDTPTPLLVTDAGVWWDDIVLAAIERGLWGLELMSGIPGGVGAAVVGNIAAYGQAVADSLEWIDVIDLANDDMQVTRMQADELDFDYRESRLKRPGHEQILILKAAFRLSATQTKPLKYESALTVARELELDATSLQDLRAIILEARRRAGSLYEEASEASAKTAGSVFKNPLVSLEQAEEILQHEERSVTKSQILAQNRIHGGNATRVSAAHVMLAAGFSRGQTWGDVRLHPEHILKVENIGSARSGEIYDVIAEIQDTVSSTLGIELEPEIRFLGEFS